ncbi:MAG: FkbM family methyltransferase [Bacteriovorax sp.]|nr:FkbM family methyltransferase [Bacteriovorax sp.]
MLELCLSKSKILLHILKVKIAPTSKDLAYAQWNRDDGDNSLRYDYPLNKDSIVFDAGGYKGDFAAEISSRFQSKVFVFEPVEKFYLYSKKRFANNPSISIFQYGVGAKDETLSIQEDENKTQMKASNNQKSVIHVQLKNIESVIKELQIPQLDLFKINIEGGEYELLEKVYEMGFMGKVKDFQIQFHDFIPGADEKRASVTDKLKKTHFCKWSYDYIWENWTLKK